MRILNAFVAIVLAANMVSAQDTHAIYRHIPDSVLNAPVNLHPVYIKAESAQEAVQGKFLIDVFWVAGFGYDFKLVPGTITFTTRPDVFNVKWAGITSPSDWKIERRWTFKCIMPNGTSQTKVVKTWDTEYVYDYPAGVTLVWVAYEIIPHHQTAEFSTNPNNGCSQGFLLQGYGGSHQIANPFTLNYR